MPAEKASLEPRAWDNLSPADLVTSTEGAASRFLEAIHGPRRLIVAVSGGGDSTGLLVGLSRQRAHFPDLELVAVTVDHRLRPESTAEAQAVARLCQSLDVEHHVLAWEGAKPSTGLQAAARTARYRLLAQFATANAIDMAVTGHNADDQAETIAMQRARNPQAGRGMADAVLVERCLWVHRPLLAVRRQSIRDYLEALGMDWIDDPSNDNGAFERIRVRQAIVATPGAGEAAAEPPDREIAAQLAESTQIHSGLIAAVDLRLLDLESRAGQLALLTLAAFMGGRTHLLGAGSAARLFDFVRSGVAGRLSAGGAVFDRRRDRLFVVRELRNLPQVMVPAGGTLIWDGRFAVENSSGAPALFGPSKDGGDGATDAARLSLPVSLPDAIRSRALAGFPQLVEDLSHEEERGVLMRRIIAQNEHFLPLYRLETANALADLAGLEHFRLPRVR